ncbi:MAG: serine hydrolase [Planctomycetia bacterium]|nr:serine hydrolase [Planctomycetia bacterium]
MKNVKYGLFITILLSAAMIFAQEARLDGQGKFFRSTPESQGISSRTIAKMIRKMDQEVDTMNSIMILRHGKVIAEAWWAPYLPETPHAMFSVSKSFTSTGAGFAVADGKLNIDSKVIDYFPDQLPKKISDNLKKMKVRDLLTMSCGHEKEAPASLFEMNRCPEDVAKIPEDWAARFLANPVPFEPGTNFRYNSLGTYMVGVIIQKATGEKLPDYLKRKLFDPLQIRTPYWETSPQGIVKGGSGLFLRTEDMAKLGQLYLQKGKWNGKNLLPAKWIEMASSKQISNKGNSNPDWSAGYGFQFWCCQHNSFRADGAFCQFIVVVPEKNLVIASTADYDNYQQILNYYWDILLPSIKDQPLPEDPDAQTALKTVKIKLLAREGKTGSIVRFDPTIQSKILGAKRKYMIYYPSGYITSGDTYPVIYLFGVNNDQIKPFWNDLKKGADQWFKDHPLSKAIVVMPDDLKDPAGTKGKNLCSDYIQKELVPHVEQAWRGKSGKENRSAIFLGTSGESIDPAIFRASYSLKDLKDLPKAIESVQ